MPALSAKLTTSPTRYDARTIALHWLTAALFAAQWLGAHAIDLFPRGALRGDARSLHMVGGVLLGVVLAVRLTWRGTGGRRLPAADRAGLHRVATAVWVALYALLAAAVALGLANAWVRGDALFGVALWARPAVAPATRRLVGGAHEFAANAVLWLALLHASAALWHGFARRDGVLARMAPWSARAG